MSLLILNLIVFGTAIWISEKATPLGRLPYRWGAYTGIIAAWTSLILILSSVPALSGGHAVGGSVLIVIAVLAAVSSLGILRRRKFGVMTFALTCAALILIAPFVESMPFKSQLLPFADQTSLLAIRNKPPSLAELAGAVKSWRWFVSFVFAAAYFVGTFAYFKNRWGLMGEYSGLKSGGRRGREA